jgi:fido (protein-threonine AMPylation protein)
MASKLQRQQQFNELRRIVEASTDGLSLDQIAEASKFDLSRTTLIRRLTDLVALGVLQKSGLSRAARYTTKVPLGFIQGEMFVTLTKPAAETARLVSGPLGKRRPVGYNRSFLDSYRPNKSSYLSEGERAHLGKLGVTSMPAQAAGTYAQHILQRLLIDLSWNSSRLEGNTYSLLDTQRLIEQGEATDGKSPTDAQMILNHKAAIEFLVQSASEIAFDQRTLLNLHALLADNLLADSRAAGRLRTKGVKIGGSVFHPLEVPQLIEESFKQILATASAIHDPFEQSLFMLVQLPYLQPYDDVNKRVSRLAANIPFIRFNLAPLSFVDVPDATYKNGILGVYELNRVDLLKDVFLWAYERSAQRYAAIRQSLGAPDPFRLHHRNALKALVSEVVCGAMDQKQASRHVATWTEKRIPAVERARFVETAETELMSLHEGNFARYQIRPSQFDAWQRVWTGKG